MKKLLIFILSVLVLYSCGDKGRTKTAKDSKGNTYEYVENDPSKARIYTLENGLKVYLSVNKDEPRIQTYIAVRAGAKNDPRETTGLAHYFEHMMFKGTDKIATQDWEKEGALIAQISDLFDKHAATADPTEKALIYAQIDSLSLIASQYAIPNEYDKICTLLGASGTNAWTFYEETVYQNEIPSNELERWLMLERERFENLVLRLFHTELETVFEEFNMNQDRDGRKVNNKVMSTLFPSHPYGVSVIGKAEHLKNPSMSNIMKFKADYYVPNNMAICLSGDFDYEETIELIKKTWGSLKKNDNVPEFKYNEEAPIASAQTFDVLGPERESISIAYRTSNNKSKEAKYLTMISEVLNNGKAGLIDLDLVKKQKVMSAYAYSFAMNDYGLFQLGGTPREGQSLDNLKELLMGELEKIKKGEFEDWLLEAIVNEMKLNRIKDIESNSIAEKFVEAFIANDSWENYVYDIEEYGKITKQELIDFANTFFKENYVVVNKKIGADETIVHIEKPNITPLPIVRNVESEYIKSFRNIESNPIEPVFINYKEKIKTNEIVKDLEFNFIKNETNDLFSFYYIFDMGRRNNKILPVAINYLKYLGTENKTIDDLEKEWYKLGVNFNVFASEDRAYVYVSGLDENLETAIKLMEDIFANVKSDPEVYNEYVNGIIKSRRDSKLDKGTILNRALMNYSKYGKVSPFTDIFSEEELRAINPEELTNLIKELLTYKHKMFYYGPRESDKVIELVKANHNVSGDYKQVPEITVYPELDYEESKILFVDYDMVQSMIAVNSKDVKYDKNLAPKYAMFNDYYSNIVFQEIRESKGLAYTCYAAYVPASELNKSNYVFGYLGTQPDKMKEAIDALQLLLNELAVSEESFSNSKDAITKQISTERIIKDNIFWSYEYAKDRGIDYDIRKDVYDAVKNFKIADVEEFFNNHVKGKKYDILIVGSKSKIDFNLLKSYGKVQELSLEEIFNY